MAEPSSFANRTPQPEISPACAAEASPLNKRVWSWFKQHLLSQPPPDGDVVYTLRWMRKHAIALLRAALIAAAIYTLATAWPVETAALFRRWKRYRAHHDTHDALLITAGLLLAALLLRPLKAIAARLWRFNNRHWWMPALIITVSIALVAWKQAGGLGTCGSWLAVGVLFIALVVRLVAGKPEEKEVEDLLYRDYLAERLMEHLQKGDKATLRCIALLGTWGAGKTTLLKLLRKRLLASHGDTFRTTTVNPWKAKSVDEARALFAAAFDESLAAPGTFHLSWSRHRIWTWISGLKTGTWGITLDFVKLFNGDSSVAEEQLIARINTRLNELNKTIVILVDDMERASPEIVKMMFPLIDRLSALDRCFFVFALDQERIAKAFDGDNVEAKGYLDKVFGLQLEIPVPEQDDVAKMCKAKISPSETPKLAAAFDQLAEFLPTNPRAAIHFLNDAKTREVLFLSRYAADEEDYGAFFLARMLELESFRILTIINDEVGSNGSTRHDMAVLADLMGDSSDAGTEWKKQKDQLVSSALPHVKGDQKRGSKILTHLFSSRLDFQWALNQHMRLLTPSAEERPILQNYWYHHAGEESLGAMIDKALPHRTFANKEKASIELIENEITRYTELRDKLGRTKNETTGKLAKVGTEILLRLHQQLAFALHGKVSLDLECYKPRLFGEWLSMMGGMKIANSDKPVSSRLFEMEGEFHLLLSERLPLNALYHNANRSDEEMKQLHDLENAKEDCQPHLNELRKHMLARLSTVLCQCLARDKLNAELLRAQMQVDFLAEVFGDPTRWLRTDIPDWLEPVKSLTRDTATYPMARQNCAQIARELLWAIGQACSGESRTLAAWLPESVKSFPEYFGLFWEATLSYGPDIEQSIRRHAYTREQCSKSDVLSLEHFDAAFPPYIPFKIEF